MLPYRPTNCYFTKTNYNGKSLYALHTELIDKLGQLEFVIIRLGEKLDYVKQIAKGINENGDMNDFVYLQEVDYSNNIPFYIKKNKDLLCDESGHPTLFSHYKIKCPMYYNGDEYVYFNKNKYNPDSVFDYLVRRGDIILSEKIGNEWRMPKNIDEILRMPLRYKTVVIPISELLK